MPAVAWTTDINPHVQAGLQRRSSTFEYAKQAIRRILTGETLKTSATAASESESSEDDELPRNIHDQTPFTFKSLTELQFHQEKADEILLVFELNIKVLSRLNQYYSETVQADSFPDDLRNDCRTSIDHFKERVSGIISDLQMQQARMDRILGVLKCRQTRLHDILNYESMITQKSLTWKSQLSTERMEEMTQGMQQIAMKTERETVSMRIVTIVALVFLPGTFISTLMSTDIIRYPDNLRVFSNRALTMYLSLTLPLMVVTFICAYLYYRRLRRRERAKWDDPEIALHPSQVCKNFGIQNIPPHLVTALRPRQWYMHAKTAQDDDRNPPAALHEEEELSVPDTRP